ncbi:MAG: molecular chaperone HscB [bacterium]|jgi:molecular chaperone HscB
MNNCWSCHSPLVENALFCGVCDVVQPPKNITPFALFGLAVSFEVDRDLVDSTYLALQKKLHPDNFVTKSQSEQMYALSAGANLNDAYNILMDNVKLSCKLLEINNIIDVLSGKPSMALMAEQFELREALEETDNLQNLKQMVAKKEEECYKKLVQAFNEETYQKAAGLTIELRFLTKFTKDVKKQIRKQKS